MQTQVVKWGNSQGIRIPKGILEELSVRNNDFLNISVKENKIILEKTFQHRTLEERAEQYGGKLGPYTEFEWEEPEGRELW